MSKDYSNQVRREVCRPPPIVGAADMLAAAQGMGVWVSGPVPQNTCGYITKSQPSPGPGPANRIPREIALKISEHLDVKDLARAALVWRSVAHASRAFPEFIRAECARFSLVTNDMRKWGSDFVCQVRDRIEQYNFAWTTLQYSGARHFNVPYTTDETPWAGSLDWKSGTHFMGESNGYLYDVRSRVVSGPAGPQLWGTVSLYQIPSFRTGVDLQRGQIVPKLRLDIPVKSHYPKAVSVDLVGNVVAILEYNNDYHSTTNLKPEARYPYLHVYRLSDGRHITTTLLNIGFQLQSEVYHMELHGEMICIVANVRSGGEMVSDMRVHNWKGAPRSVSFHRCHDALPYVSGFQFISEDIYITTEQAKLETRDGIKSNLVRVGNVRTNTQRFISFRDPYGEGWTPNNISLIRNVSPHSDPHPTAPRPLSTAPFSTDPSKRLFGLRYDYKNFDSVLKSNACLFGQSTVESWLAMPTHAPEPKHWLAMPLMNTGVMQGYDPTNREGVALIGRRLFFGELCSTGAPISVVDYNPGAAVHIKNEPETRGRLWKSFTGLFCLDPYSVAYSTTTRMTNVKRIIPTEDGVLVQQHDPNQPTFAALLM